MIKVSLLTVRDVARALDLGEKRVRELETSGVLPCLRTATGVRVFRPEDVEAYRQRREARKAAARA